MEFPRLDIDECIKILGWYFDREAVFGKHARNDPAAYAKLLVNALEVIAKRSCTPEEYDKTWAFVIIDLRIMMGIADIHLGPGFLPDDEDGDE